LELRRRCAFKSSSCGYISPDLLLLSCELSQNYRRISSSDLILSSTMTLPAGYIPGFVCSLKTCDVKLWGFVHYLPSLPGNILFLVIFSILAVGQIFLGVKYKTRLVGVSMLIGLAFETLGYVARVLMHYDPFDRTYFLWYLICLTMGPVFFAAAIYLCLGRIVVVYGEHISRIRPRTYTVFFMGCDVISLVTQAAGGGIAASVPLTDQYDVRDRTLFLMSIPPLWFDLISFEGISNSLPRLILEHISWWQACHFKLQVCSSSRFVLQSFFCESENTRTTAI